MKGLFPKRTRKIGWIFLKQQAEWQKEQRLNESRLNAKQEEQIGPEGN